MAHNSTKHANAHVRRELFTQGRKRKEKTEDLPNGIRWKPDTPSAAMTRLDCYKIAAMLSQ